MALGAQYVVIFGKMKMLVFYVNNWDIQSGVSEINLFPLIFLHAYKDQVFSSLGYDLAICDMISDLKSYD